MIFAVGNGNEVHLREGRVRLQRRRCSLSVWLTEDLGSLKRDDEKDAEISQFLSLLAPHIQKRKHLFCCWWLLHNAERPAVGGVGWGESASPAKCEGLIVQGDHPVTTLFSVRTFPGMFPYLIRFFCEPYMNEKWCQTQWNKGSKNLNLVQAKGQFMNIFIENMWLILAMEIQMTFSGLFMLHFEQT